MTPLAPNDRDAELHLLGGILRYPDALLTLAGNLRAEDFYFDANQSVFRAMLGLAAARKPLDLVTLHEELRRVGQLENVGGASYIGDLFASEPTGAMFEAHGAANRGSSRSGRRLRLF